MIIVWSQTLEWLPGMSSDCFQDVRDKFQVALVITGTTFVHITHMQSFDISVLIMKLLL